MTKEETVTQAHKKRGGTNLVYFHLLGEGLSLLVIEYGVIFLCKLMRECLQAKYTGGMACQVWCW